MIKCRCYNECDCQQDYAHCDCPVVVAHAFELGDIGCHYTGLAFDVAADYHYGTYFRNCSAEARYYRSCKPCTHFINQQLQTFESACAQRDTEIVDNRCLFPDDIIGKTCDDWGYKADLRDDHCRNSIVKLQTSQRTAPHENQEDCQAGYDRRKAHQSVYYSDDYSFAAKSARAQQYSEGYAEGGRDDHR